MANGTTDVRGLTAKYQSDRGINTIDPGVTVGGIRGRVTIVPQVIPASGQMDHVYCGIGVFPDSADAADLDPVVFSHLDWMWFHALSYGDSAAPELTYEGWVDLNIRSMRKMEEINEELFFVSTVAAAGSVVIGLQTSTLLLLP